MSNAGVKPATLRSLAVIVKDIMVVYIAHIEREQGFCL